MGDEHRLTRQEAEELQRRREEMRRRAASNPRNARPDRNSSGGNRPDGRQRRPEPDDIYRRQRRYESDDMYRHQRHPEMSDPYGRSREKRNTSEKRNSSDKRVKRSRNSDRNGKTSVFKKILRVVAVVIVLFLVYAFSKMGKINYENVKGIKTAYNNGKYLNIALFGVDSREGELSGGVNSDTIIIASINKLTGEVKLASVYRDTYLMQTDGTYAKVNSAYCTGGACEALNTLNSNLDLDIKFFATVNFRALVTVIDLLGGLDIDMTSEEVVWMNGYVIETAIASGYLDRAQQNASDQEEIYDGVHHLDGLQAVSYCRIRYTSGNDFKRTERQRIILSETVKKMKRNPWKINKILNEVLPEIYTNMNSVKLMSVGLRMVLGHMSDTSGFPYDNVPDWVDEYGQQDVVPVDLKNNVIKLHDFLFPNQNYEPSATVQEISDNISWITGLYP